MKKLFIFILFTFLVSGLFAEKIPKGTVLDGEPYVCVSKDGNYEYSVIAYTGLNLKYSYCIDIKEKNIKTEYRTRIMIAFDTEKQLDAFINKFNLSKIDKEFERVKKIVINNNPYIIDFSNSIQYEIVGSNIKF